MSDSGNGVGGVGGVGSGGGGGGGGGLGGVGGVGAASGTSNSPSAQDVADSMVDAATGPKGVNTEALGAAVAGLRAADPAFGADVQAAVEAQLSAVDAGRLQGAIDAAVAAQPNLARQVATPVDLTGIATVTSANSAYSFNAQGQLVDACGNPVASVQAPDARQAELDKSIADYNIHADKVTGGPISGPAYSAAIALGADQKTADNIHALGTIADGAVEPLAQKAEEMHVPQH